MKELLSSPNKSMTNGTSEISGLDLLTSASSSASSFLASSWLPPGPQPKQHWKGLRGDQEDPERICNWFRLLLLSFLLASSYDLDPLPLIGLESRSQEEAKENASTYREIGDIREQWANNRRTKERY